MRLYVLLCDRYFKVGLSNNPQERLLSLQTGNPLPIRLFLSIPIIEKALASVVEKSLHELLWEHRVCGEWFKIAEDSPYMLFNGLRTLHENSIIDIYSTLKNQKPLEGWARILKINRPVVNIFYKEYESFYDSFFKDDNENFYN